MEPEARTCAACGAAIPDSDTACCACSGHSTAANHQGRPDTLVSYRFSGRCSPLGAFLFVSIALAGALALGALYYEIAQHWDLVIVDALIGGALVGLIMVTGLRLSRCRNVWLAYGVAILAGVVFYGTRLVLQSQEARPLLAAFYTRQFEIDDALSPRQAQAYVEKALNPVRTLRQFLMMESYFGVPVASDQRLGVDYLPGSQGVDGSAMTIFGNGFWLLIAIETVLAAWMAADMVRRFGFSSPYCESCGQWMHGMRVAKVLAARAGEMSGYVNRRDWDALLGMGPLGGVKKESFATATVFRCSGCSEGTIALVTRRGSSMRRLLHARLDRNETLRMWDSRRSPAAGSR